MELSLLSYIYIYYFSICCYINLKISFANKIAQMTPLKIQQTLGSFLFATFAFNPLRITNAICKIVSKINITSLIISLFFVNKSTVLLTLLSSDIAKINCSSKKQYQEPKQCIKWICSIKHLHKWHITNIHNPKY